MTKIVCARCGKRSGLRRIRNEWGELGVICELCDHWRPDLIVALDELRRVEDGQQKDRA